MRHCAGYMRDIACMRAVRGMHSFEAWIARVERIEESTLGEIYEKIPPEWYD